MSFLRDSLHPLLDLAASSATRAPAYAHVDRKTGVLGNGFLETRLDLSTGGRMRATMHNKAAGETFNLGFKPFEIWLDGEPVSGEEGKLRGIQARDSRDISSLTARLSYEWFDADLTYAVSRGEHVVRKMAVLHGLKKQARLDRAVLIDHRLAPEYEAVRHDAGMYFPVVFVRAEKSSLFFCVDFLEYAATLDDEGFHIDYRPGADVGPGRGFHLLTAVIGVCERTGRMTHNPYHETGVPLDTGEREWFREYLMLGRGSAELPYLEIKGPEEGIAGPSELELIEQSAWLGAKHLFLPRILQSLAAYPLAKTLRRRMVERGLTAALVVSRDVTPNLSWVALGPDGSAASPDHGACFACGEFRSYMIDHYLAEMDSFGFRDIQVTGSPIVPCHHQGHDHAPGADSLYEGFQGLADVVESLKENAGHVSCLGPYGAYGAGLTSLCDSMAVMADPHPLPLPDIHVGRLFADMGRLYFRRSHSMLIPRTKLTNSVGLVPEACPDAPYPGAEHYPWYLYHDSAGWRYSLISALATGLRHRFSALPVDLSEEDQAFARKWLAWEHERMTGFRHVEELFGPPGVGAVDGYGYTTGRGAVAFVFNCSCDVQEATIQLGLSHDSGYVVRELHPREYNYLGPDDGLFRKDSEIALTLAPREARVIEVVRRSPASAKRKRPEVFGAVGQAHERGVVLRGTPGARQQVGIRHKGQFATHAVRFPGKQPATHITDWTAVERPYDEGVDTLPAGSFPGQSWERGSSANRNVWLNAKFQAPAELEGLVDTSPFVLNRPCWAFPRRLFFVIRFEPKAAFDPIRNVSGSPGIPEGYLEALPMKCGIDLTPLNLGLRAWVNGTERPVHPALAAWKGFAPNPHPVVAYFFEAGSALEFGYRNQVVLFARHFDADAFRGILIEHMPSLWTEKTLELK
jgi:hypothetical protein